MFGHRIVASNFFKEFSGDFLGMFETICKCDCASLKKQRKTMKTTVDGKKFASDFYIAFH